MEDDTIDVKRRTLTLLASAAAAGLHAAKIPDGIHLDTIHGVNNLRRRFRREYQVRLRAPIPSVVLATHPLQLLAALRGQTSEP